MVLLLLFGCNIYCILVGWLWKGSLFFSIFLFCTMHFSKWWRSKKWPKRIIASHKLNVKTFKYCECVDWTVNKMFGVLGKENTLKFTFRSIFHGCKMDWTILWYGRIVRNKGNINCSNSMNVKKWLDQLYDFQRRCLWALFRL